MLNDKLNLPRKTFKFIDFSSLIALNIILLSANANSLSNINVESANFTKWCESNNINSVIFNLNFIKTTQTESLTIQNKPCASTATKPISQINTI